MLVVAITMVRIKTYSSRVNCEAIVLVLDNGVGDDDVARVTNIVSVSVVSQFIGITSRVIGGNGVNDKIVGSIDTEALNWMVLDVQSGDS